MNILLIEDDIQLNNTITKYLTRNTHDVTSINDGDKAITYIDMIKYDLYIIDINIPNINGLEIVKYIRQKDLDTPVIIITASLELENFKIAFDNGCSEYIKKPFYLEELKIRIDNLIKNNHTDSSIQISSNITFDTEFEELTINNEIIKLRKKERRLLTILLQNINKSVLTETIENYIWENEIRESYPLRQLITELRKKFNDYGKFIFSEKGIGYRFEIKK